MRMLSLFFLATLLALPIASVQARDEDAPRDRRALSKSASKTEKQVLAYGKDREQRIDYWPPARVDGPLVIYVHGGGWKRGDKSMMSGAAKLSHWQALGYGVASVNYRLVPEGTVEQQAEDIATAVAHLKTKANELHFDASRIALIGHSAGAHLVALVGTDPSYFRTAGLSFADVRGIVPLDGACYDVPRQIKEGGNFMHDTYLQAFGSDPERQQRLSPITHAASPNAPEFLILHVQRDDGTAQSRALADALRQAGTPATVQGFPGRGLRGHAEINRKLGEKDYPATPVVDGFFAKIFSESQR